MNIHHLRTPLGSVEQRRAERELFFWTACQWLRLIGLAALTAYLVVTVIQVAVAGDATASGLLDRLAAWFP